MNLSTISKSRPNTPNKPKAKLSSTDRPHSSRIKEREKRTRSPSPLTSIKPGVILSHETDILEVLKKKSDDETITTRDHEPSIDSHMLSDFNETNVNTQQIFGKNEFVVEHLMTDLVSNIKELDESSIICKTILNPTSFPSLVVQQNTSKAKPLKTAHFLEDEIINGPKPESVTKSEIQNNLKETASKASENSQNPEVAVKRPVTHEADVKEETKRPKTPKGSKHGSEIDKNKKCDQGDAEVDDYKENGTQVKFTKQGAKAIMQKCLSQGLKQIIPSTPKRKKKIRFMDWKRYHRLNVIYSFLDDLEREYPAICTVTTIGKSVEGRDIKMIKISNSDANNSAVWLDGSIHSREWISAAVVTYIADAIVKLFDNHPKSVTNKDWHIVPVVNPDGYEHSHTHDRMWRKNCCKIGGERIGVDLNRNFSYGWGYHGDQGSSDEPRSVFYRGPYPFSEPESIAIRDTILQSGLDFKVFLSFHSYFQLIIFPWGHKAEPCSAYLKLLEGGLEMARAIQSCYGLTYKVGCTKDLTYCACGTSIDWSFAVPKIPYSYMIELRNRKHKFKLPREQILPNSIEVWAGVQRLMEYVDANDLDLHLIDPKAATIG